MPTTLCVCLVVVSCRPTCHEDDPPTPHTGHFPHSELTMGLGYDCSDGCPVTSGSGLFLVPTRPTAVRQQNMTVVSVLVLPFRADSHFKLTTTILFPTVLSNINIHTLRQQVNALCLISHFAGCILLQPNVLTSAVTSCS